jgi:polyhydroxyalkanoate synthesis regulator phasin
MSEHDQTRKFADKSAAIASETLEKGKAAAEQATRAVQQVIRPRSITFATLT